jgi:carbonic anhydrase
LLRDVFDKLHEAREPGSSTTTGPLNFSKLAHHLAHSDVYQYGGSLTTPPCTEGIAWNVVKDPIYIDPATYKKAKKVMKFNSRYTQNIPNGINLLDNARVVLNTKKW